MEYKGRFRLTENVTYELRDKDGNLKPLFVENKFGTLLLKFFRKIVKHPIDEYGQIKKGMHNHLAAFGLQIKGLTGDFGYSKTVSNLVTDAGKAAVAGLINGVITDYFDYIALGTGTTAAAAGDTTLQTETSASGLARAASTNSRTTTDVSNDTARLTKTFTAGASVAITEAGVFSASSSGTLLSRQVFSAVNVVSGDTFTPTFDYDID